MSDLAQELIAGNKATKAKFLDLGNCSLDMIPAEVGGAGLAGGSNAGGNVAGAAEWQCGGHERHH